MAVVENVGPAVVNITTEQIDGHPIESARDFYDQLDRTAPGQKIELDLWRGGHARHVEVEAIPVAQVSALVEQLLGMELSPLDGGGYRVTEVRSGHAVEQIGILPGDFLIAINGKRLANDEALRSIILGLRGSYRALVIVQRGNNRYHVTVPLL